MAECQAFEHWPTSQPGDDKYCVGKAASKAFRDKKAATDRLLCAPHFRAALADCAEMRSAALTDPAAAAWQHHVLQNYICSYAKALL